MPVLPRPDQRQTLKQKAPAGPLFMLNLLKFKEKAAYADGRSTTLTGAQAYALYLDAVSRIIEGFGGRMIWDGIPNVLFIGDGEIDWDRVLIVEYPSLDAFLGMTTSADYQSIHVHREAGLDGQLLINCLSLDQAQAMTAVDVI